MDANLRTVVSLWEWRGGVNLRVGGGFEWRLGWVDLNEGWVQNAGRCRDLGSRGRAYLKARSIT